MAASCDDCATAAAACETRFFFDGAPEQNADAVPDCLGATNLALNLRIDVRLVRASSLDRDAVAGTTRALARYYARYGIAFRLTEPSHERDLAPLLVGSRAELDQALLDAGLPTDSALEPADQVRADAIVADVMLAPLREFLGTHAVPREPLISMVVLERLVEPSVHADGLLRGELNGLGLSPELFEALRETNEDTELFDALHLPAAFTPTLLVDFESLDGAEQAENVLAHEVGHTLGLVHTDEPGNLMNAEVEATCRAWLSPTQGATIAAVLAAR